MGTFLFSLMMNAMEYLEGEEDEEKKNFEFLNRIRKQTKDFETQMGEKIEKLLDKIQKIIDEKSKEGFSKTWMIITYDQKFRIPYDELQSDWSPDSILISEEMLNKNHITILKNKLVSLGFKVFIKTNLKLCQYEESSVVHCVDSINGHVMQIDWSESKSRCIII